MTDLTPDPPMSVRDVVPIMVSSLGDVTGGEQPVAVAFRLYAADIHAVLDRCCGHSAYDHTASNVIGCYHCECEVNR